MTEALRLFHFSEEPDIGRFDPRPVEVPSPREPGMEWLNGPLVWAVTEAKQATYLFPRDCPRILLWLTDATTVGDRERWWGDRDCSMIAHIEWSWFQRIREATLYRYELPAASFRPIDGDAWMQVSSEAVEPVDVQAISDVFAALSGEGVELRVMDRLRALGNVWSNTLHASGIRLRNARD